MHYIFRFYQVELDIPLEEQGPFDLIIQKVPDYLGKAVGKELGKDEALQMLQGIKVSKGWSVRNVFLRRGGGGGGGGTEFQSHIFFFVKISLLWLFYRSVYEFFLRVTWRTLFFSRLIFPLSEYVFVFRRLPSYNSQLELVKEVFAHCVINNVRIDHIKALWAKI